MSMHKNVITLCCAAAFALGLAACSSSDDPAPPPTTPPVEPMPSAYEEGKAAIMAAMTVAEAQAAHAAVDPTMVTAQEAMDLMAALNERVAMILADTAYERGRAAIMAAESAAEARAAYATRSTRARSPATQALELAQLRDSRVDAIESAAREMMQKQALMDAAGMLDTSDLSTQEAVTAARMAIVGLQNALDAAMDVSDADKAMYMSMLTAAEMAVGNVRRRGSTSQRPG